MTITQEPSAPLVAVIGATGAQGGSVVRGLEESNKAYRVRAFTRDGSKPAAQDLSKRGVEVITMSLIIENKEQVYKVFEGVDFAFLVTTWENGRKEKEVNEGKLLIDASKAGGASRIIWSGLPSYDKLSGGRIVDAHHFESKAVVTEYARESGVPFVDLQAGFYGTNLLGFLPFLLSKQADETYAFAWPVPPTLEVPFIDIAQDYGLWARYMFELAVDEFPHGKSIVTHSEMITLPQMARQLSEVTGKEVRFKQISSREFGENVQTAGFPAEPMVAVWKGLDEFGWKSTTPHTVLPRLTRTWKEFAGTSDWSKVLN
ncbi:NmrA domain-containing protein [Favolaschia claudopus]|uniref:NmrA domain-containing protein n=1 Tax=Favolaschia claudopus TaxID=2862362 RepID=A0AAW0A822_9AGAR